MFLSTNTVVLLNDIPESTQDCVRTLKQVHSIFSLRIVLIPCTSKRRTLMLSKGKVALVPN
jgi:hypothetical protein